MTSYHSIYIYLGYIYVDSYEYRFCRVYLESNFNGKYEKQKSPIHQCNGFSCLWFAGEMVETVKRSFKTNRERERERARENRC